MKKLAAELYTHTYPKVMCVGKNYLDHAKEMNSAVPTTPLFFDKPIGSVMRSGEVLYLKRKNEIHHEIELGLLIGK